MILDEVFDALDKEGLKSVQHVIQTLAERVKKVLVITHSEIIKGTTSTAQLNLTRYASNRKAQV